MAFLKASSKAADVEQTSGNSKYINGTGMFPVTILAGFVSASKGGATTLDFYVDHEDQKQVLYGNLSITNNDGNPNEIGTKTANQLLVTQGIEVVEDPTEGELPIGAKGATKDVALLDDLMDLEAIIRVQTVYSVYQGSIKEKKVIRGFYRADKASASEVVNDTEIGLQYAKDEAYMADLGDANRYEDGVTPEQVKAWIAAKRPRGTAGESTSTEGTAATAKPNFTKKRSTFSKK